MNAYEDSPKSVDFIRLAVTGQEHAWQSLQERLFTLIDVITKRVMESTPGPTAGLEASADLARDMATIAADWGRAKLERPSLENEKIRAEIASEFAEAKRRLAEARKAEVETSRLEQDMRSSGISQDIANLERLMRLVSLTTQIGFKRIDGDGHLYFGSRPIGEADGD